MTGAGKFLLRLRACAQILSRKRDHWILLSLDRKGIVALFEDEQNVPTDIECLYHGFQPYNATNLICRIAEAQSPDKMALDKAAFDGEAAWRAKKTEERSNETE